MQFHIFRRYCAYIVQVLLCYLIITLYLSFSEEKILHLNPEQEKDKTYSLDSEVHVHNNRYLFIVAEFLRLSFIWVFHHAITTKTSLSLGRKAEKHIKGYRFLLKPALARQLLTIYYMTKLNHFAIFLSCADWSRIGVNRKTSSLGVAGKQL